MSRNAARIDPVTSYTIHEPGIPDADPVTHAEAVYFVKEGVAWWALFFPLIWLLYHRMWIVLTGFAGVLAALQLGLGLAGVSATAIGWSTIALSVLFAIQANDLRRWTLARRGYEMAGAVTGRDRNECELKYFATWLEGAAAQPAHPKPSASAKSAASAATAKTPKPENGDDVIGLFPETGQ